ncbi:MAG: putative toxin-antitoxin system toxin component, PIN family [Chloroflexota bacterium]
MLIVIDTNIWISGLLWKGDAWRLLRLAEEGDIKLCIAYPMLLELEEVLGYERLQPRLAVLQATPTQLSSYALNLCAVFDVSRPNIPIVDADPDDDTFLVCAVEAQANYLVIQDRHLLALKNYKGIPIVTVADFFHRYTE